MKGQIERVEKFIARCYTDDCDAWWGNECQMYRSVFVSIIEARGWRYKLHVGWYCPVCSK